jgi:hypothetical protein
MSSVQPGDGAGAARARGTERIAQALLSTPFLGAAIAVFTWPIYSIRPGIGLDPSWVAGLYMGAADGLQFGKQFVFAYGPLGFLQQPSLYDGGLWMLSFAYQSLIHVALATSLLWVARRAFPLVVALAASYVLLVVGYLEAAVVLLSFSWCVVALDEEGPRFAIPLVVFGGGALAAIELLGKANFGIAVFSFCAVALLGIENRRRNVSAFAAVVATGLGVLWLASGQALANVPDFASNLSQVIGGYSQAMGADLGGFGWVLPCAILTMALLLAAAALAGWRERLPRRLALLALVALFAFFAFKQGFVRQGPDSRAQFFVIMLGGGLALASLLPARLPRLPPRSAAFALVLPLLALTVIALPGASFWRSLEPGDHTSFLREDLHAFLSPGEREQIRADGQEGMRAAYGLDRSTLRLVGHRPVHVDPLEIGVAWAYGLNWHPLPVIQDYQAYTPSLDRLNAEALSGADGPAVILRQDTGAAGSATGEAAIDDRYPGWSPPAAKLAMLCNFRAVRTTARWQVLDRADDRCGPARSLGSVSAETGEEIAVPLPPRRRDIVFARIHGLAIDGWESLRSLAYRARDRTVTFGGKRSWRLVAATAEDGLIMRAAPAVDFPKPFQLAPDAGEFSVQVEGGGSRQLSVEFFAQRVGG